MGDVQTHGTVEYWQTYAETLQTRTGDCEDGAILMYVLCRVSGIPANRLLILTGDVRGGGHCWLSYKPMNQPWNLTFLDWCYYYTSKRIETRPKFWISKSNQILGNGIRYKKLWWAFNENNTYIGFKPTYKK